MSTKAHHRRLDAIQGQLGAGIGPPMTCVTVQPGESKEEAYQRHLKEHPDFSEKVEAWERVQEHRPKDQPIGPALLYVLLSEEPPQVNQERKSHGNTSEI